MQSAASKRVVIVGGGVAGSTLVKLLEDSADVTLIDPKDYFEVPYAGLRCLVEPSFAERSVIIHNSYIKKATFLMAAATGATQTEVSISTGDKVPFDFLVICTGSEYDGPGSRQERLIQYQEANRKLAGAQSLLVIGGGPVGVELAGEIVTEFPSKKVTLLTSGNRLLEFLGPKASDKALKWLQKKKVEVIFNDKVDPDAKEGNIYTTRAGRTIQAELHFWCIGKRLGNAWVAHSDFKDWLDEIKQGYLANQHAAVIAENVKKLTKDPSTKKLTVYKGLEKPFGIVTLGRDMGIAQLPCCTCIGCIPGMFKKDLFVGDTRKSLGLGWN